MCRRWRVRRTQKTTSTSGRAMVQGRSGRGPSRAECTSCACSLWSPLLWCLAATNLFMSDIVAKPTGRTSAGAVRTAAPTRCGRRWRPVICSGRRRASARAAVVAPQPIRTAAVHEAGPARVTAAAAPQCRRAERHAAGQVRRDPPLRPPQVRSQWLQRGVGRKEQHVRQPAAATYYRPALGRTLPLPLTLALSRLRW